MNVMLDANILLRLAHPGDPQHASTLSATEKLHQNGDQLWMVPQNVYEFWSVATRPLANNGLGFAIAQVAAEVVKFKQLFLVLADVPAIYAEWERLVLLHAVVGKNVHDTRLVATMTVHRITHLLTINKRDFLRYTNITVLTPADVMAMP